MLLYYILIPFAWLLWHIGFRIRVDGGNMGGRQDITLGLHLFQVFAPFHPDAEPDVPQQPGKGYRHPL